MSHPVSFLYEIKFVRGFRPILTFLNFHISYESTTYINVHGRVFILSIETNGYLTLIPGYTVYTERVDS